MIIPLEPRLEGRAESRFFSFAQQMLDRQAAEDSERIGDLVRSETRQAPRLRDLEGQCEEYTACVRVLGDLAQLRWRLVESGYGLELHSPRRRDERVRGAAAARRRKEAVRNELRPRLRQQFSDPHVRKFIRRMERPPAASGRKPVHALIADGAELQARLSTARRQRADGRARAEALRGAVRPYLQLVEPGLRDDRTGLLLGDVWRYFRYTWSIPQTPIPGRNLLYLVRDAAHETHAVVGIAALSNCAVQLAPRDRAIGWSLRGLVETLEILLGPPEPRAEREASAAALRAQGLYPWLKPHFPAGADPSPAAVRAALGRVVDWLSGGVSTALGEIERRGLATEAEIAAPTPRVVERLRHSSREFASRRQEALAGRGAGGDGMASDTLSADVPVDDDVLDLEAKHSSNVPVHNSRRMLVRKKRAFELARLLDARRVLAAQREALVDRAAVLDTLDREDVRTAVNAALSAIKSRRIGTNLLEITTCGAVSPYNRMLGGKLVALLLLSPRVAADYRRRYGREATIIRSQLKNARVVPDDHLVWLGTTSLFSHNSSQYERLRLPAGVIAPDQPEIRYTYLGDTSGYGTVQFADDTVRALDGLLQRRRGFRNVNGVFGEGASPRLRKLRAGLDAIGFDADLAMLHHQGRRIYGAPLFAGAGAYLCGLETDVPAYVRAPDSYAGATERIAEFWRRRWLSSRLAHDASWAALGETRPWRLSSFLPLRDLPSPAAERGGEAAGGGGAGGGGRLEFWRRLAAPQAEPVPPSPADAAATPSAAAPPEASARVPGSTGAAAQEDVGIRFVVGESVGAGGPRPYHLHPSNTRLNQLNVGVVGDLGTGKTQLTKALIYRFTRQAARNRGHAPKFLIFDYKRDYTKADFVRAVDARVVSPHRIPLNVFDLPSARGHLRAARLGRVKFLNDVLQKIYGGIGPRQRNHLKTAVMRAYDAGAGAAPTLTDVVRTYADLVGDRVDAPYSILSDLDDLEVFVDRAADARPFDEFFSGVTVIDLAALGIGDKERNMLLVLFLNLYYEYMINLEKRPYVGKDPQLRFIDSMLLVDEADNVMKYNFDVLRQVLLQGREFGVGVLLASQYLSHFRTRETDYSEPLLTWFIHKVPNVSPGDLRSIGLNRVTASTVEAVKTLDVHHCFYKTLDVPGRFMRAAPFHEALAEARP